MYRYTETAQNTVEDFEFPVRFRLDENNRWVILSQLIPWKEFEEEYATIFSSKIGARCQTISDGIGFVNNSTSLEYY